MTSIRVIAVASLGVLLGQSLVAQTPFRYREYALGTDVASVVKISKTREEGTKTLHERPARIQELEWRAPYVSSGSELADPVRDVLFSFYDDQLYQVVVTYDRDRMEGLTNDDVIESISATYGVPLLRHARAAQNVLLADMPTELLPRAIAVVVHPHSSARLRPISALGDAAPVAFDFISTGTRIL